MIFLEPLVSVLMPAYNCEKYLKESIQSILDQTYRNLELIIIDDGSQDNTKNIIIEMQNYDDRIKFFENEKNMGLPYTRNRSVDLSKGEYLAILDADDIAYPTRLEKQIAYFLVKDVDVVSTDYELFGEKIHNRLYKRNFKTTECMIELLFFNNICNSSAMIKKEFLTRDSIQYDVNCKIAQDYKLWTEIALNKGQFGHIEETLLRYRTGHENTTKISNKNYENRKSILTHIFLEYLNGMNYSLTSEEFSLYMKFFADTTTNEKILKSNILDIISIYKKMLQQTDESLKEAFKRNFTERLKLSILYNKHLLVHDKIAYFKILEGYGVYIKGTNRTVFVNFIKDKIKESKLYKVVR